MTTGIIWDNLKGAGVDVTASGLAQDDGLATLALISLFTDARAAESDITPDGSDDLRGWVGDSFSDEPWGSRLWLLSREKLTTDVRNRAVSYAQEALAWFTRDSGYGVLAKSVSVTGSIPRFQTLALTVAITKPDNTQLTFTVSKRWEAHRAL